jgi:hypothetical protein
MTIEGNRNIVAAFINKDPELVESYSASQINAKAD